MIRYRYTLSNADVLQLIPNETKEVCLFATYSPSGTFSRNVELYIRELARHFSHVVVLAASKDDASASASASASSVQPSLPGFPAHVSMCRLPNQCLDFGLHWQVVRMLSETHPHLDRIGLVNDSCSILAPLDPLFKWANELPQQDRAFWGVTRSVEINEHLQSYFLIFDGRKPAQELLAFAAANDIAPFIVRDKMSIVRAFEIGLSQHMKQQGYKCAAFADLPRLQPQGGWTMQRAINPSYYLWDKVLGTGCPLLKKTRARNGDPSIIQQFLHAGFTL